MCKCQFCITAGCDLINKKTLHVWGGLRFTCYHTNCMCIECISNAVTWTWPFPDYRASVGNKFHQLHCSSKINYLTLPWCTALRHFCQSIFQLQMWVVRRNLFFPFPPHKILTMVTYILNWLQNTTFQCSLLKETGLRQLRADRCKLCQCLRPCLKERIAYAANILKIRNS